MGKLENRVWIELDVPRDRDHAKELCEQANRMLGRLAPGLGSDTVGAFFLNEHGRYCFGGAYGYTELEDNGMWFNLEHLGRP